MNLKRTDVANHTVKTEPTANVVVNANYAAKLTCMQTKLRSMTEIEEKQMATCFSYINHGGH